MHTTSEDTPPVRCMAGGTSSRGAGCSHQESMKARKTNAAPTERVPASSQAMC